MSKSRIHQIVSYLDKSHTPFAVSRLIMLSGVMVRSFGPDSYDSPEVLHKVRIALRCMLNAAEMSRIQHIFEEGKEGNAP